jgi:uncharacterized protein (TIGR03083 family)
MAGTTVGREPVVDRMAEVWTSLTSACRHVGTGQWDLPTDCPGWTVRDQLSHLVGIERMLLGDPSPPPPPSFGPHVLNDFGRLNEAWVDARRSVPGDQVLAELESVIDRRLEALSAMDGADFDRVGWSPVGDRPYRHFMESRIVDTWAHEQDVRDALERPGGRNGAGEAVVLDRCEQTMGYVVGKRVAPPDGTGVLFDVTGALGRTFLVTMVDGRARAAPLAPGGAPTVTLTLDQRAFWRLAFGRVEPSELVASGDVQVDGDSALGFRVLGAVPFMT